MPASFRHQAAESSGSSHALHGRGRLPCLRRLNRSSSAAATTRPSTTSAADESWKTALTPSTFMEKVLSDDPDTHLPVVLRPGQGAGARTGDGALGAAVR